jgi:hypothetical protein
VKIKLAVIDDFAIEAPKTRLFAQKLKAMGLDSVLFVTDNLDDNLALASRNLPNVLVLEAHQADPVSLVRFPRVIVHQGCGCQDRGDAGMSKNFNQNVAAGAGGSANLRKSNLYCRQERAGGVYRDT